MKCSGYIPVCYPTKDLNETESDRTWLQGGNGTVQINGQAYDTLFTPCNTNQNQGNEKEILRQTMVQQEATFKNQVNELHRLYNKQRELMGEFNVRELSGNNSEGKTSTTDPVLSQNLSELTQTSHITSLTLEDPSRHWPSSMFKFQPSSNFDAGNSMQAGSNTSITAGIRKDPILLPSSGKKFRKRTFDFDLSADQYIDCEEERSEEINPLTVSQASDGPSKNISSIYHQNSSKLSIYNSQSNHSEGNSSVTGLTSNLVDLNKTFCLEKEATLYSTSHPGLHTCMSRSMPVATKARLYFGSPANSWLDMVCLNRNSICDPRSLSVGSFQNTLVPRLEYSTSRTGPQSSTILGLNNAVVRSAEEVDSASIISGGLSNLAVSLENIRATQGNEKLQDTFRGWHCLRDTTVPNRITNNGKESLNRVRKCQIDLNSSLNEDGSAPVEVEMKIAAPSVSLGNNEFSLPRGNSEKKQLIKFVGFTVQEDECPKQDLAMVAAETLVLISCGISFTCLQWFAGIVSFAASVPENEIETFLCSGADSNNSELFWGGISEYAAAIPQLKEMKSEENCCKSTGPNKRIGSTSSASQPKRKRTRRTKSQKEIQGDIPPCVTSPAKHEMSEELHKIDGLKGNEGKTSSGKKKLSKSERQKGKKRASTSLSIVAEGSSQKQQTSTKLGFLEGCSPAWGKRNKRQCGQRFPARNLALI